MPVEGSAAALNSSFISSNQLRFNPSDTIASLTMKLSNALLPLSIIVQVPGTWADDLALAINMVNQARQSQGIPLLAWNPDLAAYAQFWANMMGAGQHNFSHAPPEYRPQQGETVYTHQSGQCDGAFDNPLQTAMWAWIAEGSL